MNCTEIQPLSVTIPQAIAAFHNAETIVLACHVNPDGDALGSMLGLAMALKKLGKKAVPVSVDGIPYIYRFLPGTELVVTRGELESYDLAIVLDSGDLPRIGEAAVQEVKKAKQIINVDHHVSCGHFGDINVIAPAYASTSEIVYDILEYMGIPITTDIATNLFTGVITDTGSFRFQNVTPNTFRVAANLIEHGAPPAYISDNVFENRSLAATQLLGAALSSLEFALDGRVVWATVRYSDFTHFKGTDEDTEGIVNYVRGVRGAEVGILFRELADGTVRTSLRSKESVNVAVIAKEFGGGGHRMASGCTLTSPMEISTKKLIDMVIKAALASDHNEIPALTNK